MNPVVKHGMFKSIISIGSTWGTPHVRCCACFAMGIKQDDFCISIGVMLAAAAHFFATLQHMY